MTPGALNIKGGSKEPLNISIDDEIGVTITSPKKLTLAAEDEIIMKTPKSVKLKAESQIFVAKENSQSGFSLENEMHFKSNNVIKDGSCRDTYEAFKDEPEAGQKPPTEEGENVFNWGGLLMAAAAAVAVVAAVATLGIGAAIVGAAAVACIGAICSSSVAAVAAGVESAMGDLAISSCAAVCGAVLWDFSEQDDTNNYSWEDADKYINSRLLGICIGNKIYYNHEISNLPREITYKKNGYTYTYMLDEHKQYFMGLEMPSGPDITLKDGRVISDKKYEYKLAYTDEPKLLIGMIQVSPGKTSVAGKAKGGSVKEYNVKEGTVDIETIPPEKLLGIEHDKIPNPGKVIDEKIPRSKGADPNKRPEQILNKEEKKIAKQHLNDLVSRRNGDTAAANRLAQYREHALTDRRSTGGDNYAGWTSLDLFSPSSNKSKSLNIMRLIYKEVENGIEWKIIQQH